jgi:hypothetical protein
MSPFATDQPNRSGVSRNPFGMRQTIGRSGPATVATNNVRFRLIGNAIAVGRGPHFDVCAKVTSSPLEEALVRLGIRTP